MSEQPIDQYLTLDFFKKMLQSKTSLKDDLYLQFVNDSNGKVQTAISLYIDTPLESGSVYFSRARNATLSYARSLHAIDIQLTEKSKTYIEQYNIELYGADGTEGNPKAGGLIQELISKRSNRTKTVLVVSDARNFKVILPTQTDLFTTERFG